MGTSLNEDGETSLLAPLRRTTYRFYVLVAVLLAVIAFGGYAYFHQLQEGLSVTGLSDRVSWGVYISNLVFFIGISYGGTLISAILRLLKADWRKQITRLAETTTVTALLVAAMFPLFDIGRPDRMQYVLFYSRIESPIVWDFVGIFTYLVGAILYLYLPLIPDLALIRRKIRLGRIRDAMYRILGEGWLGTSLQRKNLERSISVMAVVIIPVAIAVHTVLSWIFGMTLRAGWHTAIFGPYFVGGAIFSGVATVITATAVFRWVYRLEKYITLQHFRYLGSLLLVLDLIVIYFTVSEYLTAAFGAETQDVLWLRVLTSGPYAYLFWIMLIGGFIFPAFLLSFQRSIRGIVLASVLVNVAMWLERFLIVVPTLMAPQIGADWALYTPTWIEWSLTAAAFAGFVLLCAIFSKLFPIVSIWETRGEPVRISDMKPTLDKVTG